MRRISVLMVVACLGASACTKTSQPLSQAASTTAGTAASPMTTAPPVGQENTPTTKARRKPKKGETEADVLVKTAIEDVEQYWTDVMPDVYDIDYEPVGSRMGYDKKNPPSNRCSNEYEYNASYCPPDDSISWDREGLIPDFQREFGDFAVAFVVAHEWGHAIQRRGGVGQSEKTILKEQQADCFAGAWAKHAFTGKTKNIKPLPGDLERAVAAAVHIKDPVGRGADEKGAHGSAFDRVNALQEGFEQGPKRCVEYQHGKAPVVVAMKFNSPEEQKTGGNAPYDATQDKEGNELPGIPEFIGTDAAAYYGQKGKDAGLPLKDAPVLAPYQVGDQPTCDGRKVSDDDAAEAVYYCKKDNIIAFDDDFMRDVYGSIGDFGVGTLLVEQYGVAAQQANKIDSRADESVLQQDCMTGAYAFSIANGEADGNNGRRAITLSPGDLDEAVVAFLAIGQDPAKTKINAFGRVSSFRTGYQQGEEACKLRR